jgi:hypothetical protein
MRKVDYPYEEMEKKMIEEIGKLCSGGKRVQRGVLATSANDMVTARLMGLMPNGLNLYAWTNRNARKHKQILENPNVAVVVGGVQVEGVAHMKGHPMDEPVFLEQFKSVAPENYEREILDWREYDQLLIDIYSKRLALYDPVGDDNGAYLDVMNVEKKTAFRFYDHKVWDEKEDNKDYWE